MHMQDMYLGSNPRPANQVSGQSQSRSIEEAYYANADVCDEIADRQRKLSQMRQQPAENTTKGTLFSALLCSQLCGAFVFLLGIGSGVLISIFLYPGGPSGIGMKCITEYKQDPLEEATTLEPIVYSTLPTQNPATTAEQDAVEPPCYRCPTKDTFKVPKDVDIFAPLTEAEMNETYSILHEQGHITQREVNTSIRNYISHLHLYPPKKEEAIKCLDFNGTCPGRYATVHVVRADREQPDCMVYKVGPLGPSEHLDNATDKGVFNLVSDGEIHVNARVLDFLEYDEGTEILGKELIKLNPLFRECFDGAEFPEDLYVYHSNSPFGLTAEDRFHRASVSFKGYHHFEVLPIYTSLYCSSQNVSEWYVKDFYYMNQGPFDTAEDLLAAYNNNTIRKIILPKGYRNLTEERFSRKPVEMYREFAETSAPRTYEPSGSRYTVEGSIIKWLNWRFHLGTSAVKGPRLFNVQFNEERILYELALNELVVTYAGDNVAQNGIVFLDNSWGFIGGKVMPGLDCPQRATIVNITIWDNKKALPKSLPITCIFEANGQGALWRHVGQSFAAGQRDYHLVVRTPVTLGNYDYVVDYMFYNDGRIVTRARATGYIQAHFWDSKNPNYGPDKSKTAYGYRVSDFQVGSIHDHTFGFKADMDIINSNNTFRILHLKSGNTLGTQNSSKSTEHHQHRYMEWETLQTERGLKLSMESPTLWTVVNEAEKNKWGIGRGYQIQSLATNIQNLPNSFLPMDAISYTKYHCSVTKQKDDEQYVTSVYDVNRLSEPRGHLDLMLDNEPIVNEDLVTWITVGLNHVPTSEDVPFTTNVETGFVLRPHNFFDRGASFDQPQFTQLADQTFKEREPTFEPCYEIKPQNKSFSLN